MSHGWNQGCMAISIDTVGPQNLALRSQMAERLADQLAAAGLSSTWAITAQESSWGRTLAGTPKREWALRTVLDEASSTPTDWSRGWDQARCHGWRGTTIALVGQPSAAWLGWAQRHQVSALLPLAIAPRAAAASSWAGWLTRFRGSLPESPSAVRWGIWSFPSQARCSERQTRVWRRPLEMLVERGGLFHLAIELAWLVEGGRHAWRAIDLLTRVGTRLRDAGLESATLGELAGRLNLRPAASPARSILRPAA